MKRIVNADRVRISVGQLGVFLVGVSVARLAFDMPTTRLEFIAIAVLLFFGIACIIIGAVPPKRGEPHESDLG